jgi:NADH-quinone oxidoreductase subunit J
MLQAEFLAAMQILVYVGGVLILITFAVMLTRTQPEVSST